MNYETISSAITSLGFPIVCCVAMMWYVVRSNDKNREEINRLNEQHRDEMNKVTEAINNNTLALQKLCDKIDG